MSSTELSEFLKKQNLTQLDWDKADIEWDDLKKIAADFEKRKEEFEQAALSISALLQRQSSVHSVRWRIKDTEHLLAKIIRKRSASSEKYQNIDEKNYDAIVTDLVGVRVLHLFKEEWARIQRYVENTWTIIEGPTAYVREGDNLSQYEGCKTENHDAGYRSIHSIITTKPFKRDLAIELQVRTVFEEGWSEIDHNVRYPNFSDNPTIAYFLHIFNGLSGFADEMGTFVKILARDIETHDERMELLLNKETELEAAELNRQEQLDKLEELGKENTELQVALEELKRADASITSSYSDLKDTIKKQVDHLRAGSSISDALKTSEYLRAGSYINDVLRAQEDILKASQSTGITSALKASEHLQAGSSIIKAHEGILKASKSAGITSALKASEHLRADSGISDALRASEYIRLSNATTLDQMTESPDSTEPHTDDDRNIPNDNKE
ncbi:RelA/SpoT domain-containing protein [Vibrio campbellii]|uniref:RelA/SpoT domain-containing protein n=1 Tax=Vibrio campbellii TaxID=680 RepID=UPI000693B249|nr:RelA/SpoT domain-containing protein [Vibrio campbellii]